jgi:signal transduction histidine kinase
LQQVLAERNRLARELHDTLAQSFLALLWQMESAEIALAKGGAERAQASLQRAKGQARDALKETRRAVQALRAEVLEDAGSFPAALTALVQKAADGTGLEVEVRRSGAPYPLREAWEQTLLRVAQEALHNTFKYAQARCFEVGLDYEDAKRFRLSLRDDGKGFEVGSSGTDPSPDGSTVSGKMGLPCMRERCRSLGGELCLSSRPGAGTCIEVRVPVQPRLLRRLRAFGRRFWPVWAPFGQGGVKAVR